MNGHDLQPPRWTARLATPGAALAMALAAACVIMLLPQAWLVPLRAAAATVLRPGQRAASMVRGQAEGLLAEARRHWNTSRQLAEVEREVERLRDENRRLAGELTTRAPPRPDEGPTDSERLLQAATVRARFLGVQARAFLKRHELLDAGARQGVEAGALVVEPSQAVIDRGRDARLAPGRLVLDGACVWGKVVEVGPLTSVVLRTTEPGYRDVVRLATHSSPGRPPRLGPEGILEGTGEPLARIRMVPVSVPVEVGDEVYASGSEGVLPAPLRCGRVARAELPAGATHWDLWMEPAVGPRPPDEVAVLKIELNPLRVARGP